MIPSRAARLALVSCVLIAAGVEARTPEALQCQSKVWRAVADVGPRCHGTGIDYVCPGAAVGQARNRTERILGKRQSSVPPNACIPHLCTAAESPFACADKLVTGNGAVQPDALDRWREADFRCLRKSARLLGKLAKSLRRCARAGDGADACRAEVEASFETRLEESVSQFVNVGASFQRCTVGGCRPNADLSPCVRTVVSGAGDDDPPPGGGDPPPGGGDPMGGDPPPPGDLTPEEAECRSESAIVLAEYDNRAAKCVADSDDVPACLLQARQKREEKVTTLLDDHRVRPEVCFPDVCTAGQTPEACAFAVFEAHEPDTGEPPPGGGEEPPPPPTPAQACRQAARAILDTLADDLKDCRELPDEAAVGACLQQAVDAHRPDMIELLDGQLAQGIPPEECLPILCGESAGNTTTCADAAIASVFDAE